MTLAAGLRKCLVAGNRKMHALPRPEGGVNLTVRDEAERVIEVESVGVCRHGDARDAAPGSDRSSVLDELAADPLPHRPRINEEILKVIDAIYEDRGREPHDLASVGGDSAPPSGDPVPFRNQRCRVGQEGRAVTRIGQ